jgi:uncharacterized protein YbjT (DUF2867 family)
MKVLIAGANSYIAKNLIPSLLDRGHEVVCQVRDKKHFQDQNDYHGITVIQGDLLRGRSMEPLPYEINAAYYLVNSLSQTSGFAGLEALSATNFITALNNTACRQIITISELSGNESQASRSRGHIEEILADGQADLTSFKTGMVIGAGSIALEMLQELTHKSTIIVPQKWALSKTQPIAIADVVAYLTNCLLNKATYKRVFDVGGPEVMTFKELLITYTQILKHASPAITVVPYLSSKIIAHWLNLLTPLSYPSAQTLLESLEYDAVCQENSIIDIIPFECMSFDKILLETCLNSTAN